ncbi:MAG: hypothetical protein A2033_16740 [Bacteroidetes bacterium GWA2_31_9]|nr:MAG: hypothetical protein A2033_16740 [Bacteroidetes bacterium GWA2_31_9]
MQLLIKKILLLKLLVLSGLLFSQSVNTDSLENVLKKKSGVEKIEILNIISKELTAKDIQKSQDYAEEALSLSLEFKNEKEEASSYYNLAEINSRQREYEKAVEFNDKSYKIRTVINDREGISQCFNLYGIINKSKGNTEEAIKYFQKSIETSQSINEYKTQSQAYNNIGGIYQNLGEYNRAIDFFKKAQILKEKIGDKKGNGISLQNIGNCYLLISDFENSSNYYSKAIKIFEQIDYKSGIAKCLNSFGMINESWEKLDKAIEYYQQSLKIYSEIDDKTGIAEIYNNLGNAYAKDEILDKAQEFYLKALNINLELGNKLMVGKLYKNIGFNLTTMKKFNEAFFYLDNALNIFKELNNPHEIVNCLNSIGQTYYYQKKYDKAIESVNQSLELAIKNNIVSIEMYDYDMLAKIYSAMGDYKKAFEAYTKFHDTDKLVFNAESDKVFKEMQTKYESEKKQKEIELLNKDKEINESKIKQQNLIIYGFLFGFIIVLAFIVLINRQYRQKKRAFSELEVKNKLITHQKLEITDSIHYAERIQRAVLPQTDFINTFFPEHFVLFCPKDIVSGDFYWMNIKDNVAIIAAADCTGHGVPGAFMSMLGVSFLNEIVNDKGITQANLILNELRKSIIKALQQTGKEGEQKDGMDISLIAIKHQDSNSKSQIPSFKFQIPSEEESEKVRDGESEKYSVSCNQLAVNDAKLQSSEMFIEKESINNPVATTNENQGGQVTCDSETNNKQSYIAQWAGANNPIWIVRAVTQSSGLLLDEVSQVKTSRLVGTGSERGSGADFPNFKNLENLEELKGDKMPVAIHVRMDSFTNHELTLNKGDLLYIFTDGFADQFGGQNGKKFKYKPLKELLIQNSQLSLNLQKEILFKTFTDWKSAENNNGTHFEQVDDVLIIGLKI